MGKPAARLGDSTVHGGVVTVGFPTVLIGGQPAARIGDFHTCPMQTPAGPAPIPHVGGPITLGSPTVLIGNMPAARMGDMCTCVGPPDSIAAGCPTVLIGESGSGSGGGGGGAGMSSQGKAKSAVGGEAGESTAVSSQGSENKLDELEEPEAHSLSVKFVDGGGKPIVGPTYRVKGEGLVESGVLAGKVSKTGVKAGNYDIELMSITKAEWSTQTIQGGDSVKLQVEVDGVESGAEATFQIFIRDLDTSDQLLTTLSAKVQDGMAETEWKPAEDEKLQAFCDRKDYSQGYSQPSFLFTVSVSGMSARSSVLKYEDWIELTAVDSKGNIAKDMTYKVILPNGEVREGEFGSAGKVKLENIPLGRVKVFVEPKSDGSE